MKNFQGNRGYGGWKGGSRGAGAGNGFARGGSRGFDRPQMHRATCVKCGNGCEVPFRPNGSKPVFCRDCFRHDGQGSSHRFGRRDSRGFDRDEKRSYPATCAACGDRCDLPFRPNGSKPVYCRGCFDKNGGEQSITTYDRNPERASKPGNQYAKDFRTLNEKLDTIIEILNRNTDETEEIIDEAEEEPAMDKKK